MYYHDFIKIFHLIVKSFNLWKFYCQFTKKIIKQIYSLNYSCPDFMRSTIGRILDHEFSFKNVFFYACVASRRHLEGSFFFKSWKHVYGRLNIYHSYSIFKHNTKSVHWILFFLCIFLKIITYNYIIYKYQYNKCNLCEYPYSYIDVTDSQWMCGVNEYIIYLFL